MRRRRFLQTIAGTTFAFHCWSDRPGKWWAQNHDRPSKTPPVPASLVWDTVNMRASNATDADELIHKRYRKGFGILA